MEKNLSLSPEEILGSKERAGDIKYDDYPKPTIETIESETVNIEPENPLLERVKQNSSLGNINNENKQSPLGKVENTRVNEVKLDSGWKNLPLDILPSGGLYYPEGTRIAIRPAEVSEIRHFSTIDDSDKIERTDLLNFILERCLRMQFPMNGVVEYRDIIQEDRFYIILAIRDLTFIRGENRIILKTSKKCKAENECPYTEGFELRTGALDFFSISEGIMKYYSQQSRSFEFKLKDNPADLIKMYIPTIGVQEKIDEFKLSMEKNKIKVDKSFLQILPYMFQEWRGLTTDIIYSKFRESDYWTKEEFSLYFMLSKELKVGTKLEATLSCPHCHEEVKAPILFKNGIKSIFVISDILGQLL